MAKEVTNRTYKDSVFRELFGNNKENAISLYNAVNDSNYSVDDEFEYTTLKDAVYMKAKNDVAFLFANYLNLYEHQSTFNPNMPLRGFNYHADMYRGYIEKNSLDVYSSARIMLPTPSYIVFYNGTKEQPSVQELKLSDSFTLKPRMGIYEWTATVININHGENKELMDKCRPLYEYSVFVAKIRAYLSLGMTRDASIDKGVDDCIREGILSDFLRVHRAEVKNMFLTEYNEELHISNEKQLSYDEGYGEGRDVGYDEGHDVGYDEGISEAIEIIVQLKNGQIDIAQASKILGMEESKIQKLL